MLAKLAILAIFGQFPKISSSIGIDTTWVNIGDFKKLIKLFNFANIVNREPFRPNLLFLSSPISLDISSAA